MQVNGYSKEMLEESMKNESACKKLCIAIGSGIHLAFAAIVGIIFAVWLINANNINGMSENFGVNDDVNIYDTLPALYIMDQESYTTNPYTYYSKDNWSDAMEYWVDIEKDCADDISSCMEHGNRFSVIYALSGVTMLLLAANSALMILGAWSFHARGLAGCCGSLCCCLNLASIITTGVFRFNHWGKLSMLCEGGSKYVSDDELLSDDRTV